MIIGYDFMGYDDGAVFDSKNVVNKFYRLELLNAVFDEINVRTKTDTGCSSEKQEWQFDTKLLAKFQGNLEAGNIQVQGNQIEFIQFKKRKIGDLEWLNVAILPYELDKLVYEYDDKFVEAGEIYEYAILPLAYGGIEGEYVTDDIECKFDHTWLFDKDNNFKLMYNIEYGDIETVMPSNTYEPLGSKYPIVSYNGELDYRRGVIKSLLIADNSTNGKIDVRQEKLLRNNIINFLKNKKPKIIKDSSGNYLLISIIGNPKLVPNNNLSRLLYEINFEFIEIGNVYDENTLIHSGLK